LSAKNNMSQPITNNLSSYSDDGRIKKRIAQTVDLITPTLTQNLLRQRSALEGEEALVSVTADIALSANPARILDDMNQQRPDEEAISERQNEEEASSPPGTIGDRDIMSEHITAHHGKYKKNKVYTTAWMDDGVSEEAHKSTVTKISKVAEVSQKVELQDTSRSVKGFSLTYDRI